MKPAGPDAVSLSRQIGAKSTVTLVDSRTPDMPGPRLQGFAPAADHQHCAPGL